MLERARVILKKGVHTKVVRGNPWIYDNEILKIEGDFLPGDVVDIYDVSKSFIGRGFINPNSKIRIRILTRKEEEIDKEFFRERILKAWEYRKKVVDTDSCRVVFAEADFLP
ncbi:MAG: PUA domain-containing protein, partial [Dictyoglomus sp.]